MAVFEQLNDHQGPKNLPTGCNLGGLFPSPSGNFFKKNQECSFCLYSSPWLSRPYNGVKDHLELFALLGKYVLKIPSFSEKNPIVFAKIWENIIREMAEALKYRDDPLDDLR